MTDNIIFISYPSGGFGNFVYHVVSNYFANTHKVPIKNFAFDSLGTSHATQKYLATWFHDPDTYTLDFESDSTLVLLVDNGINNDSYSKLRSVFKQGTIIRLNIDESSKPVVYKASVIKAMRSDLISNVKNIVEANWIDSSEDYALRENFTLFYKNWPFKWQPVENVVNINISELIKNPLATFEYIADAVHDKLINVSVLTTLINDWKVSNKQYFDIVEIREMLEDALDSGTHIELPELDLHDQGYINYCIERKYDVIIPVYDYRNWFQSSTDIQEMIKCLK